MIRKTIIAAAVAALAFGGTACNTVKRLGEDIQSVGRAGEEAID